MEKKKLLVLVPNIGIGGQERVAVNTVNILKEDYNTVLAVFYKEEYSYEFYGTLFNLELPPVHGIFNMLLNLVSRARALKKLKREYEIDVTMSFGTSANLANALAKTSDKVLVSIRGYGSLSGSRWGKIIGRLVYREADTVVTVAKKLSGDLANLYQIPVGKVKTLYNPYDMATISEKADESIPMTIDSPAIVSVGRMQKIKGYRHLLNAMTLVIKAIPHARLILVGDGDEMTALREYAEKVGLVDHVTFAGFQSNPYSYEAKCDLYVLSSISEGFPNAMAEAMACGLPVVATDCKTGPREILMKNFDDKTAEEIEYADYGVLVPPFASDESHEPEKDQMLAKAIIEMLTNHERCNHYKVKSIERSGEFSFARYRRNIIKIIEG